MNEELYQKVLPLKNKWEIFKHHHYSEFTNLDFDIVKEVYTKLYGPAPRNMNCHSCIQDLLKRVFIPLEQYENDKI